MDQILTTILWIALTLGVGPQVVWGQFCGQSYDARIATVHQQAGQLPGHQPTLLLTGSSSIRLWPGASSAFPQFEVINAGFGGSCYSDLWALRDTLLFAFEPDVVVIYEGDNDLSDGLPQSEILSSAQALFADIAQRLPDAKVVVLAPKPSLARQHLAEECRLLSDALGQEARRHEFAFVDFWDGMHLADGTLNADLFVGDGLHLNREGYDTWVETLRRELPWLAPKALTGLQQVDPAGKHVFVGAANGDFLLDAFHRDVRVLHALNGVKIHDVAAVNADEAAV